MNRKLFWSSSVVFWVVSDIHTHICRNSRNDKILFSSVLSLRTKKIIREKTMKARKEDNDN